MVLIISVSNIVLYKELKMAVTKLVNINHIKVENRKRKLSDITNLKESIEKSGLINPITVNSDMRLITGYHRLQALRELGKIEIEVRVVDVKDLQAELMEIDENLIRQELTQLENADQLKRRKQIYEKLFPDSTQSAKNMKNAMKRNNFVSLENIEPVDSFTTDTAKKIGKSKRSIQQCIKIAEDITPEAKEKIKGTKLENSKTKLIKISQTAPEKQIDVVEQVLKGELVSKMVFNTQKPRTLDIAYKVDFVLRKVIVNGEWLDLPEKFDMDKNSYEQMKLVANNYKINKKMA